MQSSARTQARSPPTSPGSGGSSKTAHKAESSLVLWNEYLVDRQVEEPGDPERERQRRHVPAVLDGDHRLTGDGQGSRELGLGQPSLSALLSYPVLHYVKVPLPTGECQGSFTTPLQAPAGCAPGRRQGALERQGSRRWRTISRPGDQD